jgi:hypothetical protein
MLKNPSLLVAVGPDGSDYSNDGGKTWDSFSEIGYHAVKSTSDKKHLWASGSQGRIGKLVE